MIRESIDKWFNIISCSFINKYVICQSVSVGEVTQVEVLLPDPNHLEVGIIIAKLEKCKWTGSDKIPAELIYAGGETLLSVVHNLISSIWNMEGLPDQWKECIIVPDNKKSAKTACNNCWISLLSTSYEISFSQC
jgi:hypothetical protein